jgi:hypothetical protein
VDSNRAKPTATALEYSNRALVMTAPLIELRTW